jgi:hypothetical protein
MKMRTRTNSRRKRRKTTTGSRRDFLLTATAVLTGPLPAADKKKKAETAQPYAVIAGTVFRPPGLALPAAEVRAKPETKSVDGVKLKAAQAFANTRGEFSVRVPPVPAKWTVHVQCSGYTPQTKTVSVEGEQRFDLSFLLEPETAKPKGEGK